LRKHNTSAERTQRNPLVKIPENLSSVLEGNEGADGRDFSRRLSPGLRLACFSDPDRSFKLFVAPGEGFGRQARREIEQEIRNVGRPDVFPDTAEFEFTTSPSCVFQAASGLPEDYRTSTVDWAIELSQAVLICVDMVPGKPAGEPHRVVAPIQASFRCSPDQVAIWTDFLGRRLRPSQRFAVVRFAESEVPS
jgi:hypothetical protein